MEELLLKVERVNEQVRLTIAKDIDSVIIALSDALMAEMRQNCGLTTDIIFSSLIRAFAMEKTGNAQRDFVEQLTAKSNAERDALKKEFMKNKS